MVCMEDFVFGGEVIELLCKYIYYKNCIILWLRFYNLCLICCCDLFFLVNNIVIDF